ncbi:hypothetical protein B0H94_102211 [Salsuginibacillus halophilus]|uniref:Uncharacterized protein n=1 Tax=Salsuginibacillus halophilus TaxID=517424 RepID=A0A2P8HXM4_9BACI|nr:penicillin-binding protein [Salsuginibacillus halophilus]PSL50934.1 hypothetical protein B0H94_102211 [Salsuginibacillus halophilus]
MHPFPVRGPKGKYEHRYFPFLPFLAGLAVGPILYGGYQSKGPVQVYSPQYGPQYGPSFGPSYGPHFGPGFGPQYGPQFGPPHGPWGGSPSYWRTPNDHE